MKDEPRARDRLIGARIRAIRKEYTTLSLEAASTMAQWAPAKLSRTERGLRRITDQEVATLITSWQLPAKERDRLLEELQIGASSGWWDRPIPGVPHEVGALASYEADANELVSVAITLVPGLLQTYKTAVAALTADGVQAQDMETNWMARLHRQQILTRVDYTAFISETALRTPYGGPDALREQLEHLLAAQDRGVEVRIIPAHQTRVTTLHPFHLMRFANTAPVVHVEMAAGGFYIHDKEVRPYEVVLQRLDQVAFSQSDTRTLLQRQVKGFDHVAQIEQVCGRQPVRGGSA
ncbi:DUF5753 domain-containing protein [Actinophytocola xanthii]|nr:DUF5753 domain-containing protein [Actinophytocola xanthii]